MPRTEPRTARLAPSASARVLAGLGLGAAFLALLVLIDLLAPTLFEASLPTRAQDGLTLAISVLIESLPFVALGVVLSIVVQVWVPPGVIERWMPRAPWARRAVLSLLGMVVPVCECGNVPFARGLLMRGFSVPETLTFLIAAPIVNPIVIITTHQAFGFDDGILIARLLGKDFLRLRRDPAAPTYWLPRQDQQPTPERLRDQF